MSSGGSESTLLGSQLLMQYRASHRRPVDDELGFNVDSPPIAPRGRVGAHIQYTPYIPLPLTGPSVDNLLLSLAFVQYLLLISCFDLPSLPGSMGQPRCQFSSPSHHMS